MTTLINHVESDPAVCGGKPCIAGTRIRVWDIHVWHNLRGQSPAEIAQAFPQITLADIHAALAYYLDHREEIESQMRAVEQRVEQLKNAQSVSLLDRVRDEFDRRGRL
ncbi:MAG: DUF433 domain-containing protein [Planctomycetota bacterium]|nr:DUF433 domain-containing protein [Planctomycetota bacterium]